MDNNSGSNDNQQRSALPRSLLPHLYNAPPTSRDSSTRTTLPEQEEEDSDSQEQHRSASPFALRLLPSEYPTQSTPITSRHYPSSYPVYDHSAQPSSGSEMRLPPTVPPIRNDPPYYSSRPAHYGYQNQQSYIPPAAGSSWREGEAGPSALAQRSNFNEFRGRQDLPRALQHHYGYTDQYPPQQQQEPQQRQSYSRQEEHYPSYGAYTQGHSLPQQAMDSLLSPLQAHRRLPEHMYVGDHSRSGQQDLYTLPTSGQHSGSHGSVARGWDPSIASSSNAATNYASASYSSLPPQASRYSTEPDDDDGEYLPPGRRNQKRKLESSEKEPGSRPKKTLIACDFCRGRKLRCDGSRPSCSNCKSRDNQTCVYQSHPRRRGPGKAPKGQRKKKAAAALTRDETTTPASERSRASNEESQHYSPSGDDFEVDRLTPNFRSELEQQHLPPISILPYPGPPSILPSIPPGEPSFLPQNQEQSRYQQGILRREPRDHAITPHPPYPDDTRR